MEVYTSDYYTGDPDHPVLRWSVLDPQGSGRHSRGST
jgi:hypothetical protein